MAARPWTDEREVFFWPSGWAAGVGCRTWVLAALVCDENQRRLSLSLSDLGLFPALLSLQSACLSCWGIDRVVRKEYP